MKTEKEKLLAESQQDAHFFLVFEEISKIEGAEDLGVASEEMDEIEQIRRIVMDVTDEHPVFMTTT